MLQFNRTYFIWTILLLIIEILIALYLHDPIIRPYGGDFLVIILIYCFVKSFVKVSNFKAAIGVLIFSYVVEILQYFKIVRILRLQDSNIANIMIGTSFAWADLLAYTLGIAFVLGVEQIKHQKNG
ncbi:MAG: DUF2809 domain-containing protein [Saprospiraceae bacterium]|nr:DUF2809 domain-containing protein [Saprospiraceae bacterium]